MGCNIMELLVEDHSCRSDLQEGHDFLVAWRGETVLESSMWAQTLGSVYRES